MMESSDLGERDDLSKISVVDRPPFWRVLLECEMCPGAIVVARVRGEDPAEMPLVENDDVVQALSTQRSNESLRKAVLPQ